MLTSNKPLAANGLKSYRFETAYSYVMIGAIDAADAMREARRSTDKAGVLQEWDGTQYWTL